MADDLKKQGLFVDESFILRVLEQEVQEDTTQLRDENEIFLESEFKVILFKDDQSFDINIFFIF